MRRKNRSLESISILSDIILTPEVHTHRIRDIAASPDGSLILATDGPGGKLVRVIKK